MSAAAPGGGRAAARTEERRWAIAWCLASILVAVALCSLLYWGASDYSLAIDITKGAIAISAVLCLLYEAHRARQRRPVAERWKKRAAAGLSIMAVVVYFDGLRFAYPSFYHRWEYYHYYLGAKYFPEMAYDNLYKCTVIAQDEIGVVTYTDDVTGQPVTLDMSAEVRRPDRKIRNLGVDNLLIHVAGVLASPEECKAHFSSTRWSAFKADVQFFRTASEKDYWEAMQRDHGYNPPPVWTVMGRILAELHPATKGYLQLLTCFDGAYLIGVFAALYWAFGWRVCALGAIFWGCQSPAPFFWTGGAFLRHDWLFFVVLSACLARKRYHRLAGASMVYAGLLRVFPGLVVIGWLVVAGIYILRHKRMARSHVQVLMGGVLAAAALLTVSVGVSGSGSYRQFYEHTLRVHDQTPVTNHMGLRVLVSPRVRDGGRVRQDEVHDGYFAARSFRDMEGDAPRALRETPVLRLRGHRREPGALRPRVQAGALALGGRVPGADIHHPAVPDHLLLLHVHDLERPAHPAEAAARDPPPLPRGAQPGDLEVDLLERRQVHAAHRGNAGVLLLPAVHLREGGAPRGGPSGLGRCSAAGRGLGPGLTEIENVARARALFIGASSRSPARDTPPACRRSSTAPRSCEPRSRSETRVRTRPPREQTPA
ncbi:uncharacterized protein SOCE26_030040 [Sorangium cellulosum]|uniref:Uncharacterized protein n=1 Tax=Sorangium cellulosum TaxID=56 RepID=A0A2L0EQK2_SORCE|nr:uncharacterized protein SOCE26_030040 [Sorangium cellulosum]